MHRADSTAATLLLTLTSLWLAACTSPQAGRATHLVPGFLPPGLHVDKRTPVPALTLATAQQRKMNDLEAAWRVMPASEAISFGGDSGLRVVQVPAKAPALRRDYPGFAQRLATMSAFMRSNPADYPSTSQPDLIFGNAGIYIRAKFRCLDLPWGKAAIMLVQYTQEAHPPPPNNEDLRIWIRGISHDALQGQAGFCLYGDFKVTHPLLKSADKAVEAQGDQEDQVFMAEVERQMNTWADESFSPSLKDVERMLRELSFQSDPPSIP